jgi:hypothetical protein
MARIRSIKPAFFTSEDTCGLSPLARLLFLGLLTEADRDGRLEDRPRQLKRRVLPDDDCNVDALLAELAARSLIARYAVNDVHVVQVINFDKHQRPHPKEPSSGLPAVKRSGEPEIDPASREKPGSIPSSTRRGPLGTGTGTGTGTSPLPPLAGGLKVRREHKEQAKVILRSRLGYCQHDPQCLNQAICLDLIALELAQKGVA